MRPLMAWPPYAMRRLLSAYCYAPQENAKALPSLSDTLAGVRR